MLTKEIEFKIDNGDSFIARACVVITNKNELAVDALMAADLSDTTALYYSVLKEGLVMYNEKRYGFIVLSDDFLAIKDKRKLNEVQFEEYVGVVQKSMVDAIIKNVNPS